VSSPSGPTPTGVLVMAHGTPPHPGDIERFYTAIRRGSPPSPELLAELVGRYEAIGGTSPLTERTRAQVDGLAATLQDHEHHDGREDGGYLVRFGAKFVTPTIEDGMAELVGSGVDRVVALVLTPHQSARGSGEYLRRAQQAAEEAPTPVELIAVPSWHRTPGLAQLLADRLQNALQPLTGEGRGPTAVFFTAHSVPLRALAEGDPYVDQVTESASDIAALLGLDAAPGVSWSVAWQSAGRTPDPWVGPDLLTEIRRVAAEGFRQVLVCPVGFVSDHLEVLYDLDIEAREVARSLGMTLTRTASLNDDPRFLDLLADVVRSSVVQAGPGTTPAVSGSAPPA
jgi:protoporphyrin/coproporphyrin ferrochelatase